MRWHIFKSFMSDAQCISHDERSIICNIGVAHQCIRTHARVSHCLITFQNLLDMQTVLRTIYGWLG